MELRDDEEIRRVREYHRRTEHTSRGFARSLGFLDWETQPNPFRTFEGTTKIPLELPEDRDSPAWTILSSPEGVPAANFDQASISRLFYDSLALSAWKQAGTSRWSLRVNPSSGNLHPTEAYLLAPASAGLEPEPALFHYHPLGHELERLRADPHLKIESIVSGANPQSLLIGLSSIYWRESWKYGERAFRYCQLDLGHALACVSVAAAGLGWQALLLDSLATGLLGRLLGLPTNEDPERERPECLVLLRHRRAADGGQKAFGPYTDGSWPFWTPKDLLGTPNRLSARHQVWPVIDAVAGATETPESPQVDRWRDRVCAPAPPCAPASPEPTPPPTLRQLVRSRRSAVAMDGATWMEGARFVGLLRSCLDQSGSIAHEILPRPPELSLACLVHRVIGLEPGLYFLLRDPAHLSRYQERFEGSFLWKRVSGLPSDVPLFLLQSGEVRNAARRSACGQEIASEGVASFAMVGDLVAALRTGGPWFYRRLFWEAGLLGQILYLEAEAAGLRATGIGCYFDDVTRELLGVRDDSLECFYHFTLGGPLDDPRLQSLPAYWHLKRDR